jgi:hypothetical protein
MRPARKYSGIFGVRAGLIALHSAIAAERKPVKEVAPPLAAVGTMASRCFIRTRRIRKREEWMR